MDSRFNITAEMKTRIISLAVVTLILISVWDMLDLVLLTFILIFIFWHMLRVMNRVWKSLFLKIPEGFTLTMLYAVFSLIIVFMGILFLPILISWLGGIAYMMLNFDMGTVVSSLGPSIAEKINVADLNAYIYDWGVQLTSNITEISTSTATFLINFCAAFFISYIMLLERRKIAGFGENLSKSRIAPVYEYIMIFGGNFCQTFGKVMKVQVLIAFINCILSMVVLKIIGFSGIVGWGAMIFVLGLIPVAGVIISLFPLCLMAFNIGGVIKVIEILVMIAVLHALEAYILNPNLMANKTRLPMCFVFVILLISEHYLGVWGLLIGVPLFIFFMNILEVDYQVTNHKTGIPESLKNSKDKGYFE